MSNSYVSLEKRFWAYLILVSLHFYSVHSIYTEP